MNRFKVKHVWKLLVLALLILAVGCQQMGGLDLNKSFVRLATATSMEQKSSISLQLQLDPSKQIPDEQKWVVDLLNGIQLDMFNTKMESAVKLSSDGSLKIGGAVIPFKLYLDEDELVLGLEGIANPIVITADDEFGEGQEELAAFFKKLENQLSSGKINELSNTYFITNAPNVRNLSVNGVTEKVNNQDVSLFRVEADLTGEELPQLLSTLLRNMIKDEKGLKQLVTAYYDALWPIVSEFMKTYDPFAPSADDEEWEKFDWYVEMIEQQKKAYAKFTSFVNRNMNDKEMAIDFITNSIKEVLYAAYYGLDFAANEPTPEIAAVFSKDSKVSAKMYFDRKLDLRKSDFTVSAKISTEEAPWLTGVVVKTTTENWNVNEAVKAVPIEKGKTPIILDDNLNPTDLMMQLDQKSDLAQLIQDVVTNMQTYAKNDYDYEDESEEISLPLVSKQAAAKGTAYVENDVPYIPLDTLLKNLVSDIDYDANSSDIVITTYYDEEIVLSIGSDVIYYDNDPFELEAAVEKVNDVVFVPAELLEFLDGFYWVDEELKELVILVF